MEEEVFTDYEALAEFVDQILAAKNEPENKESKEAREKMITELDQKITEAILASLPPKKLEEVKTKWQNDEPIDFETMFKEAGINTEDVVARVAENYAREILGATKGGDNVR